MRRGRGYVPLPLSVQKYSIERQVVFSDMFRGFQPLNFNVILYGNKNWSNETNMVLFRVEHMYIHASKCF